MRCATISACTARASAAAWRSAAPAPCIVDGEAVRSCVIPRRPRSAQQQGRHARRPRHAGEAASGAAGLHRRAGGAVRLLHQRHDHAGGGLPRQQPEADRGGDQAGARRQPVPLRHARPHRARGRCAPPTSCKGGMHGASRSFPRAAIFSRAAARSSSASRLARPARERIGRRRRARRKTVALDRRSTAFSPSTPTGSVTLYSGKVDLGTGVRTALTQIVAEELTVPFEQGDDRSGRHGADARPGHRPAAASRSRSAACRSARRRRPRARRCSSRRRKQLGVDAAELDSRATASIARRRSAASATAELIGGKQLLAQARPSEAAAAQGSEGLTRSSARRSRALDIPDKVTGHVHLHAGLRACPACCTRRVVRPPAIGAQAAERRRQRQCQSIPGYRPRRAQGQFPRPSSPTNEWAAIKASQRDQGDLVRLGRTARADEALGARAHHARSPRTRSPATSATPPRRMAKDGAKKLQRHLRLRDPHPRLDRALLRGCRIQGRQAHVLVGVAGDAQLCASSSPRCSSCRRRTCAASTSKAPAATAATATRTPRPTQRCSRRHVGRPVRVQWMRADEHGWDPKGPPTLVDYAGGARRRRQRRRPGSRSSSSRSRRRTRSRCRWWRPSSRQACRRDHRAPATSFRHSAIPYKFANIKADCHRLADDAVPAVLDPHAGPHAEHLRATRASWTNWRRRPTPIRSSSGCAYLDPATRAASELLERLAALAKWDKRRVAARQAERRHRDRAAASPTASTSWCAPTSASSPTSRSKRTTGEIRVERSSSSLHDCGQIINPDGAAQPDRRQRRADREPHLIEELTFRPLAP